MRYRIIMLIALCALFLFGGTAYAQTAQPSTGYQVVLPPPATASAIQLEATGDELRAHKDYEHAITYFRAAIVQDPKNAVLFNKCGIAEIQMQDTRAAKKDFKKALKLNPQYAEAANNMGASLYMERNYKKAIREYEKAIAIKSTTASFHANLGTAWFARNKVDEAMKHYAEAMKLDPEILLRSSQSGVSAQISSPEDRAQYQYVLAKLYAKSGDIDRSIECLKRAKEAGYTHMDKVYKEPEFAAVRVDPRFNGVMGEQGK
jgi:tetratricopeptide (TPR) repeat protein